MGVFDTYVNDSFPYKFNGTLHVPIICGGIPSDPKVAEGWLKSRMGLDTDAALIEAVAATMVERGLGLDEATTAVNETRNLNGFKRDEKGLYIEGRQLKAALKEAVSVAVAAGKISSTGWGSTKKWLTKYFPEHVFVLETKLYLGVTEATGVNQRFVHTWRGTGIQYEEYVENAEIDFTVVTDHDFTDKEWAMLWTTGEKQGIGATRSQGYGVYEVTRWDRETLATPRKQPGSSSSSTLKKAVPTA